MRLTSYTDYALRVLLYVGASGQIVTISKISDAYNISKDHLRKVVHSLAIQGYLETSQGRYGGIKLGKDPKNINIREVVDYFESTVIVECFDNDNNTCSIDGMCSLKKALYQAQENFMKTLEQYHLSDLINNPKLIAFCKQ